MNFEVGKTYRHTSGEIIRVLTEVDSYMYGKCLLGENDKGEFIPLSTEEWATENYEEV